MRGFSRRVLEGRTVLLGIWIARYWPVSDLELVLKPWPSLLAEFGGVLYADYVRFDPGQGRSRGGGGGGAHGARAPPLLPKIAQDESTKLREREARCTRWSSYISSIPPHTPNARSACATNPLETLSGCLLSR